ncbi:predicted protein [Plenodomus lingam JN3]|uniref:Predicted protein n=1 Tax=Leptosphaeria maculans (strain JN3 / isolate v23.1.3 / race Av1-4-5-6-7-8) TaxID=985895 RepID=E4ZNH7_LEPMJ|nr:predicted protein [Plenodomus lingam JN3]CBX93036.1 predicted protein [Plenodomus lingam JN3]
MTTPQTVRRWILTGAVAAITVTGSIYGATLKSDIEVHKRRKQILEATPEEQIETLDIARAQLVSKKNELERKIEGFRERRLREKEISLALTTKSFAVTHPTSRNRHQHWLFESCLKTQLARMSTFLRRCFAHFYTDPHCTPHHLHFNGCHACPARRNNLPADSLDITDGPANHMQTCAEQKHGTNAAVGSVNPGLSLLSGMRMRPREYRFLFACARHQHQT